MGVFYGIPTTTIVSSIDNGRFLALTLALQRFSKRSIKFSFPEFNIVQNLDSVLRQLRASVMGFWNPANSEVSIVLLILRLVKEVDELRGSNRPEKIRWVRTFRISTLNRVECTTLFFERPHTGKGGGRKQLHPQQRCGY